MLMPKRTKFRRVMKGRIAAVASRGTTIAFGDFAIKAMESGRITSRQIEAARITMTRRLKRVGQVWIRIFPDKPITQKPAETRMGGGKGSPEYWVANAEAGRVLFEIGGGIPLAVAQEAMALGMAKLPIKCKTLVRPDYVAPEVPVRL